MRISDWSSDVCSSDLDEIQHIVETLRHSRESGVPWTRPGANLPGSAFMDPGLRRDDTGIWTRPVTDRLVIALAQLNQLVGDLRGNADAMLVARAKAAGADLIVYPELQLIGSSEEHPSELQSLMRISYAVFCL